MSNISIVDGKLKLKDTDMGGAFVVGAGESFSDSLIQLHKDTSYPEGASAAKTIQEDDKDIVNKAIVSEPNSVVDLLDNNPKKNALRTGTWRIFSSGRHERRYYKTYWRCC